MKEAPILEQALTAFKQLTGGEATLKKKLIQGKSLQSADAEIQFRKGNAKIALRVLVKEFSVNLKFTSLLKMHLEEDGYQLFITSYIPEKVAEDYRKSQINYLDAAGNMYINLPDIFLFVQGRKKTNLIKAEPIKLFQPAGLRIVYQLIGYPQNEILRSPIEWPLRKLAEQANVSLGSAHKALADLEKLGHILYVTDKIRKLTNRQELMKRWVTAYGEVLRPKLYLSNFRFTNEEAKKNWKKLQLNPAKTRWGGEPAAANYTNHIKPERFTIYTTEKLESLMRSYRFIPHPAGEIEVLSYPAKQIPDDVYHGEFYSVPPLLTYADLLATNDPRNHETAKFLYHDYLDYLT